MNKLQKHQNQMHQIQQQQQHQQQKHQKLIQDITNLKLSSYEGSQNANDNALNNNSNANINHNQYPESDETKLALRQMLHLKQNSLDIDLSIGQDFTDFVSNKAEMKFQTLPSNNKAAYNFKNSSVGTTSTTKAVASNKGTMDDREPTMKYSASENDSQKSEHETESNGPRSSSEQTAVHSKTQNGNNKVTSNAKYTHQKHDEKPLTTPKSKLATTHLIPSGNLVVPPRKPISSVAPTSITLAPKSIAQSPRVNAVAPSISTAPVVSAIESTSSDKTRPALPPKPSKGSSESSNSGSSAETSPTSNASSSISSSKKRIPVATNVPTIVGVSEKLANNEMSQHQSAAQIQPTNIDNFPIKAKPLTIKKQPLSEQPRLRSLTSGIKPIQYTSRRIEMPPAFLFPEIEKAQLKSDDNKEPAPRMSTSDKNKLPSPGGSSSSSIDDTDKSTNSSISSDTDKLITSPNGEVVRRQRSSMSDNTKVKLARRVSFDPLALLLDASLEGELELVQKTAMQVIYLFLAPTFRNTFALNAKD